jgi:hypothetical protein
MTAMTACAHCCTSMYAEIVTVRFIMQLGKRSSKEVYEESFVSMPTFQDIHEALNKVGSGL